MKKLKSNNLASIEQHESKYPNDLLRNQYELAKLEIYRKELKSHPFSAALQKYLPQKFGHDVLKTNLEPFLEQSCAGITKHGKRCARATRYSYLEDDNKTNPKHFLNCNKYCLKACPKWVSEIFDYLPTVFEFQGDIIDIWVISLRIFSGMPPLTVPISTFIIRKGTGKGELQSWDKWRTFIGSEKEEIIDSQENIKKLFCQAIQKNDEENQDVILLVDLSTNYEKVKPYMSNVRLEFPQLQDNVWINSTSKWIARGSFFSTQINL